MKNIITIKSYFKSIVILLLFFSQTTTYATDITTAVTDIIVVNGIHQPGEIRIEFNSDVLPVLFDYNGPCGDPPPFELNNSIFEISDIGIACVGDYTFDIVTGLGTPNECCVSFTLTVIYCPINGPLNNIRLCFEYVTPPGNNNPKKASIIGTGSSYFSSDGTLVSDYNIHTSMPNQQLELISSSISDQIDFSASELLTMGSTYKLVASQSEINSEEDFIFKFDEFGDLVWVYHKGASKTMGSKREEIGGNENESPVENMETGSNLDEFKNPLKIQSIYPNPFHNNLNIEINTSVDGDLNIRLINMQGKIFIDKKFNASKGLNSFEVSTSSQLPSGMYLIQIIDNLGRVYTKQVVHATF